jgi:hypothetical protein
MTPYRRTLFWLAPVSVLAALALGGQPPAHADSSRATRPVPAIDRSGQHDTLARGDAGQAVLREANQSSIELKTARTGVPVATAAAEDLRDMIVAVARTYAEDERQPLHGRMSARAMGVLDKLGKSLQKDVERSRDTRVTWLSSHTLEGVASLGLESIEGARVFEHSGRFKNLQGPVAWLTGLRELAAVAGHVAGGGELNAERIAATFEAFKTLSSQGLLAELEHALRMPGSRLTATQIDGLLSEVKVRLLFLDAFAPLIEALAIRAKTGQWTLQAVDKVSDGLITAAASLLVFNVPGGGKATALRDAIVATARWIRSATEGAAVWRIMKNALAGKEWGILDLYAQYQAAQARRGLFILDIDKLYAPEDLTKLGLTRVDIQRINAQTRLLNAHRAKNEKERTALAAVEPDTPKHRDKDKLKPRGSDSLLLPPGRRRGPPEVDDGGDWPGGGGPGERDDTGNRRSKVGSAGSDREPHSEPVGPAKRRPTGGDRSPASSAARAPSSQPMAEPDPGVGGIDLRADAKVRATAMPSIAGAVVDARSGRLVVLSEDGRPLDPQVGTETFAWALWLVYSGKDLAFSLDPADPADPEGPWLKAVYYPKETASSAIGRQLFEADLLLKMLVCGVRLDGDRVVARAPGLLPGMAQMMADERDRGANGQWARMFIVIDGIELSGAEGVLRVDAARMAVRARRQVPDPRSPTGLRDVDTDPRSIEARYAQRATQLYDQLAAGEAPEFERVRQIAKALAIATWMKESGVQIDVDTLVPILNGSSAPGVDRISALDINWSRTQTTPFAEGNRRGERTVHERIRIFGGLDLTVKLPPVLADARASKVGAAVSRAIAAAPAAPAFKLDSGTRQYVATVMPFVVKVGPSLHAADSARPVRRARERR